VIASLELGRVADSRIGDAASGQAGLSGGQKRRVTVGIELLTFPSTSARVVVGREREREWAHTLLTQGAHARLALSRRTDHRPGTVLIDMCAYACVCVHSCMCMYACVCVHVCMCECLFLCLSVCLYLSVMITMSVCWGVWGPGLVQLPSAGHDPAAAGRPATHHHMHHPPAARRDL
jgi:hypothetical protein